MVANNRTKKGQFSSFFDFLKNNIVALLVGAIIITGIAMVVPYIKRWFDDQKQKNTENDLENQVANSNAENHTANPLVETEKAKKVKKKYPNISDSRYNQLKSIAKNISIALGTNADTQHTNFLGGTYYSLNSITEDEKEAIRLLKQIPGTFTIVSDLYYTVYTKSRTLVADMKEYISKEDLAYLRNYYVRINPKYKYF